MPRRVLTLDSLKHLDGGRVAVMFKQAIARAVEDCEDRPNLKKPRKVQLVTSLAPFVDEDGSISVDITFDVKEAAPARASKQYSMKPCQGELEFNELSPENANQGTFEEMHGSDADAVGA